MNHEKVQREFNLLAGNAVSVQGKEGDPHSVDREACARLVFSAQTLIRSTFGDQHPLFTAITALKAFSLRETVETASGIIGAASDAWRKGLAFEMADLVRADVEVDLIDQAIDLAAHGYNLPAVVVAGAVLEQHLRSVSPSWGVATRTTDDKLRTTEPMNADLKKATAYDATMAKRITFLGGMRNEAAHGNSDFKDRGSDVTSMIREVVDVCSRVKGK